MAVLGGALCLDSLGAATAGRRTRADTLDLGVNRDKLRVFTDGQRHYVVLVPFDFSGPGFFYGDGKQFYAQRGFGGGRNGDESFNRSFWDPRAENRGQSIFQYANKKYTLTCGARETVFQPLSQADGADLIAGARFHRPMWKRQSYWLARDDSARFYFLDRMREPQGNNEFRLFIGPKGALKAQKLTKVVSNTKGDIFSTKGGELHLISSSAESSWRSGRERLVLTTVPIEDNHVLVYTDLGVYKGEKLGTPCDDL